MRVWTISLESRPYELDALEEVLDRFVELLDQYNAITALAASVRDGAFGATLCLAADSAIDAHEIACRVFLEALDVAVRKGTDVPPARAEVLETRLAVDTRDDAEAGGTAGAASIAL